MPNWPIFPEIARCLSPGSSRSVHIAVFIFAFVLGDNACLQSSEPAPRRIAAIVTEYRHNSHADVIVGRLLQTDTLDGKGRRSPLRLASLYTDQKPPNDLSRQLAVSHGFPIFDTIEGALTLGTGQLAVDGVFLIAEHGKYPKSATGNTIYPKRRFWDETLKVFDRSRRVVPVFIDKHLADNWADALYIYKTARDRHIPLMAGSSVPSTWRRPPADVARGQRLREIVAFTYGSTDAYGFHGLEAVQSLAEQRAGGETGVRSVRCLTGAAVWEALDAKLVDPELFESAWKKLPGDSDPRSIRTKVKEPLLMVIDYRDGLKVNLFELNGAVGNWAAAWRYDDPKLGIASTLFWTQEARPAMHFSWLLRGVEKMMQSGQPTWNVERTLLTSGVLDAFLRSRSEGGRLVETPYLEISYTPIWRWSEPPPPPPGRPWSEQ